MSNTTLRLRTLLDAVTAAGATTGYPLDFKGDGPFERPIQGTLIVGDTIDIQVSLDNVMWTSSLTFAATPFAGLVVGPWNFIRVNKTGTTGAATVKGNI